MWNVQGRSVRPFHVSTVPKRKKTELEQLGKIVLSKRNKLFKSIEDKIATIQSVRPVSHKSWAARQVT